MASGCALILSTRAARQSGDAERATVPSPFRSEQISRVSAPCGRVPATTWQCSGTASVHVRIVANCAAHIGLRLPRVIGMCRTLGSSLTYPNDLRPL